jgi:hypothetical protein
MQGILNINTNELLPKLEYNKDTNLENAVLSKFYFK